MSKKKNDIFEYEKQWQLYKGNEYMYRLLSKMSPKVECNCPKSYLFYQKMSKNNMQDITKKHELMLQNKILKKKLLNSKSTVNIPKDKITHSSLMQNSRSRSQRSLNKALEEYHILWENSNMFKRICNSKSFFSTVKCYSTVLQDDNSKKKLHRNHMPNRNINSNNHNKTNSFMIRSHKSFEINKDYSFSNNHNHNNLFPEIIIRNALFDYNNLKEEIAKTNTDIVWLYKKNRFISNIGLVSVRIQFQSNKLNILIEPISSSNQLIYSITISDEYSLSILPYMFESYDDIIQALKYYKNDFVFRSKYSQLSYYTQAKLGENTYKSFYCKKESSHKNMICS